MNQPAASQMSAGLNSALTTLMERRLSDGGFAELPGGGWRPDATAWAILALDSFGSNPELAANARARLASSQLPNGSIPIDPEYPEAFWPTAIAAMALNGTPQYAAAHGRAIDFLLNTSGRQLPKETGSPIGHDSMIPGWAWIDRTHSWVEPTAMAVRTLSQTGLDSHERVRAGISLLLDRQLPKGGWNYGNTTVFEKVLHFMPSSTGIALWALTGLVDRGKIAGSLALLEHDLPRLNTPLTLGWALHGLAAWGINPSDSNNLIQNCLQRQHRFAPYGTSQLGILLTAAVAAGATGAAHA